MMKFSNKPLIGILSACCFLSCKPDIKMKRPEESSRLNLNENSYSYQEIFGCVLDKKVSTGRQGTDIQFYFNKNLSSQRISKPRELPDCYTLVIQPDDSPHPLYIEGDGEDYRCLFQKAEIGDWIRINYYDLTEIKRSSQDGRVIQRTSKKRVYTNLEKIQ